MGRERESSSRSTYYFTVCALLPEGNHVHFGSCLCSLSRRRRDVRGQSRCPLRSCHLSFARLACLTPSTRPDGARPVQIVSSTAATNALACSDPSCHARERVAARTKAAPSPQAEVEVEMVAGAAAEEDVQADSSEHEIAHRKAAAASNCQTTKLSSVSCSLPLARPRSQSGATYGWREQQGPARL
jgi:hypothetical protein